jgi:cell division protein FtsQ
VWDNPRQLNLAAGALLAVAVLLAGLAALQLLLSSPWFPVREIVVLGRLEHTARAQIEGAARERVAGNFFAADLGALRAGLEKLPWVRRVSARRLWPDRIEVMLEEHVALARWGESGLVNTHGERFAVASDATLPLLGGPPGTETEVTRRYREFAALLAPLGEVPERVILTPRYAWQLRLARGLHLELGRDSAREPVEQRLARFIAAYPRTLARIPRKHEYVDLRYPNGFALRVPELKG